MRSRRRTDLTQQLLLLRDAPEASTIPTGLAGAIREALVAAAESVLTASTSTIGRSASGSGTGHEADLGEHRPAAPADVAALVASAFDQLIDANAVTDADRVTFRRIASRMMREHFGGASKGPGHAPDTDAETVSRAAAPTGADTATTTLGRYRVLRTLGKGGMGIVTLAEDPRLGRFVAIKQLTRPLTLTRLRGDFEREARALAGLNHPNIVVIHSLEDVGARSFITMEWVKGRSLAEVLRDGALPVERALRVARQLAAALEAAHSASVVHHDIKPGNIMVLDDDRVKVLDFGLASLEWEVTRAATPPERMVFGGTPGYMSPEQISLQPTGPQSDAFAFGCVLYECLTGLRAFGGRTPAARMHHALTRDPDWDALPVDLPDTLRAVLKGCLDKDAAKREPSMAAVRRRLDELAAELSARAYAEAAASSRSVADAGDTIPSECLVPNNLTRPLTSFIGREALLEELDALLGTQRLATLTGAGGSGKSRLAVEVALRTLVRDEPLFGSGGVWFVELARVSEPDLVPSSVADALGVSVTRGMSPIDALAQHLARSTTLVVLDNCEHLLGPVTELVTRLLRDAPGLTIVTTSRESLKVEGEVLIDVPQLSLPPHEPGHDAPRTAEIFDDEEERAARRQDVASSEAVHLFVDRAHRVKSDFALDDANTPAVVRICRRLDGIPLAIELAAARLRVLTPEELATRLDVRFDLLTGHDPTALPHHRTLRALLEWSLIHLDEKERVLLRRLSVFIGGWDLGAAEAVCAGDDLAPWDVLDTLSSLMDKSLVTRDEVITRKARLTRYRMLETIRFFAAEQLEERPEESTHVTRRLLMHAIDVAEAALPHLEGSDPAPWLDRLGADLPNAHVALSFAAEHAPALGLRLARALGGYWIARGPGTEALALIDRLLGAAPEPSETRARVLVRAGRLATHLSRFDDAHAYLEEARAIARSLGKPRLEASAVSALSTLVHSTADYATARRLAEECLELNLLDPEPRAVALARRLIGFAALNEGDTETARSQFADSLDLFEKVGDLAKMCDARVGLGIVALTRNEYETARKHLTWARDTAMEIGESHLAAVAHTNLGVMAGELNDFDTALDELSEALRGFEQQGNRAGVSGTLNNLGLVNKARGAFEAAKQNYEESAEVARAIGNPRGEAIALSNLGLVLVQLGNLDAAIPQLEAALEMLEAIGDTRTSATTILGLGRALRRIDPARARERVDEASERFERVGNRHGLADADVVRGELALDVGNRDVARSSFARALHVRLELGDEHGVGEVLEAVAATIGDDRVAAALLGAAEARCRPDLPREHHVNAFAEALESRLGEAFATAREHGASLSSEEIVRLVDGDSTPGTLESQHGAD